jgi:transcriptional regulator with GAF, ATPase, and Fis domain
MNRFAVAYRDSFRDYIHEPSEATLRTAYELGRDAVEQELSVLDLAIAHHDALASVLRVQPETNDHERIVRAAGDFFLESISAFEMVQRGFREARDAALVERRHAEMLRQLSHFLADVSLALDASGSLDEMLRLVAEQARELIPAECCLVETGSAGNARVRAASYPEEDLQWIAFVKWVNLSEIGAVARSTGRPTRMDADEIATRVQVPGSGSTPDLALKGWLGAPLVALDGSAMGSIHLVTESERGFTALHEAVIQHLAQMSAAAIERARLYSGGPSSQQ